MLGAIIGDTVGSVYEFNNKRSKDIELFTPKSFFTDDSIMSLALCECLLNQDGNDPDKIVAYLKKWGRAYPDRGYGGRFYNWLFSSDTKPYRSYGNGAAMRISAAGWYGRDEEEVKELAHNLTAVTHNHPEGLKGAEVTAMCVYYARIGKSKEFIKEYVSKYYNLDFDYEDLKINYYFNETCQETVPQAIYCFLISKDFEDCLRTTISIGGDCDTTAAISCAIAEAYYKSIEPKLVMEVLKRLPKPVGGCNPKNILIKFLSDKAYLNSFDEEITNESYVLSFETITKNNKNIEFIYSKSLQAISEYFIFNMLDYYLHTPSEMGNETSLLDMDLKEYFHYFKLSFGREELFNEIERILREMLNTTRVSMFDSLICRLDKLSNHIYDKPEYYSKLTIFNNYNEAYNYLVENYNIENELFSKVFNRSYEKKGGK